MVDGKGKIENEVSGKWWVGSKKDSPKLLVRH